MAALACARGCRDSAVEMAGAVHRKGKEAVDGDAAERRSASARRAARATRGAAGATDWERVARSLAEQLREARLSAAERESRHKGEMDVLVSRQSEVNRELVTANATSVSEINKLKFELQMLRHRYACLERSVSSIVPALHAELEAAKSEVQCIDTSAQRRECEANSEETSYEMAQEKKATKTADVAVQAGIRHCTLPGPFEAQETEDTLPSTPSSTAEQEGLMTAQMEGPAQIDLVTPKPTLNEATATTLLSPGLSPPKRPARRSTRPRRPSLAASGARLDNGTVCYKEPALNTKLRKGMPFTFGNDKSEAPPQAAREA